MCKILYRAILALCVLIPFQASALKFTIKVDKPEGLESLLVNYNNVPVSGSTIDVDVPDGDYGNYVNIYVKTGYVIGNLTSSSSETVYFSATNASFTPTEGATYILTMVNLADVRTDSFTLKIDDASKARIGFQGSTSYMPQGFKGNLEPNTINYSAQYDGTRLGIMSSEYNVPLYKVTVDGVNVTSEYGSYYVDITPGCTVEVLSQFPEGPCTLTLTYGDGAEGFWQSATLNGTAVDAAMLASGTIEAKLGDKVELTPNPMYTFESLTLNGGYPETYLYGSYSFTLVENSVLHVNAHRKQPVKFTLNIDTPENVWVFNASYSNGQSLSNLVPGDNQVEFPEDNTAIYIAARPGCSITSIMDADGNTLTSSFNVTAGMTIYVTTDAIKMDQTATLVIDDLSKAAYFSAVIDPEGQRIQVNGLHTGENEIAFSESLNTLSVSWYVAPEENPVNKFYLNGKEVAPLYEGTTTFQVQLHQGDVLRAQLVTEISGISDIESVDSDDDAPVYDLRGVKVATRATIGQLPAGLYITGGKKVLVK